LKKIEAIVRTERLEDLKKILGEKEQVHGLTVSQVLGFGNQIGFPEYVRGQEVLPTFLAKVKLEIVTHDRYVDEIVNLIIENSRTGEVGDGKIFILPIEEVIRIRTGENQESAL